jgi:hypothetical protein
MLSFVVRSGVIGLLVIAGAFGCSAEGAKALDDLSNGFTTGGAGSTTGGAGGMGAPSGGAGGAAGMNVSSGGSGGTNAGVGGMGGTSGGAGGASAGGMAGAAGMSGGMGGASGMDQMPGGMGGAGGMEMPGGMGGMGGAAGDGDMLTGGDCCPTGNCICHGEDPTGLTNADGPFDYDTYELASGTVYYPMDAEPPFAAIAICPGFLNSGPEMAAWGPFYASHGFVLVTVWTIGSDIPEIRAIKLVAAVDELKAENDKSGSPLMGKLAGRYGTSGYSMGGGGTTIATTTEPSLMTSIGLAAWGPVGSGVTTPTLFLCGESDGVAPCFGSQDAYNRIPEETPKMIYSIPGATHFSWFGPDDAGRGASGARALAFQKVFLNGDERWREHLIGPASTGTIETNIE